jgi:hypothetical protein
MSRPAATYTPADRYQNDLLIDLFGAFGSGASIGSTSFLENADKLVLPTDKVDKVMSSTLASVPTWSLRSCATHRMLTTAKNTIATNHRYRKASASFPVAIQQLEHRLSASYGPFHTERYRFQLLSCHRTETATLPVEKSSAADDEAEANSGISVSLHSLISRPAGWGTLVQHQMGHPFGREGWLWRVVDWERCGHAGAGAAGIDLEDAT